MIKPLFQNILVVVTGSRSSIDAVRYAVIMAKLYNCKVTALYVVDTATIKHLTLSRIFAEEESREYEKSLRETGLRYLSYTAEIGGKKHISIKTEMLQGSVSAEILNYADENKIDTILLGADDVKTNETKDMLAKTVHLLLTNAKCSILLVKEEMIEQLYKMC